MIGFLGCISNNNSIEIEESKCFPDMPFIKNEYQNGRFSLKRKVNAKFEQDKVFSEDDDLFIAVDGVILNIKHLKDYYGNSDNFNLLSFLFKKKGKLFINELKGDFSLVLYNKITKELVVYTNISTSKPIYYFLDKVKNELFFASNSYQLAVLLKSRNYKLTVNEFAFYSVASFNYVFSDHHFTNEIKKLPSGCFLSFKDSFEVTNYYNLSNYPQLELSEKHYLSRINEMFQTAVKLQYDKDLEYNYNHISTLSGGLDSRMTTLVGHKLGYKNIDVITFSSPGYWDEIISKEIAKSYNLKHYIFNVNDGNHLKSYKHSLDLNGGLLSYYVASQMLELYGNLDFTNYGLLHTGQIGDAIIGSTLNQRFHHYKYGYQKPEYSIYYASKLEVEIGSEMRKNDSFEMTKFKNHVPNFTMQGNQYMYPYTESISPFLDKDLLRFCMRIPLKDRKAHNLYYKWIEAYYPDLGRFYYEKTKRRTLPVKNKMLKKLENKFFKHYLKLKGLKEKNNSLLNFNLWGQNNELMQHLDSIFDDKLPCILQNDLKENMAEQYKSHNIKTKLKALHVVLTYELYFS